ncbi:hypothetical protein RJ55_01041 [Drechmeria coniospora]|nr:hypothetical protein RJ55_01041 [Drechmeria coniospora]
MSSLVSEFIINPVLRHARRFSEISLSAFTAEDESAESAEPAEPAAAAPAPQEATPDAIATPPQTPRSRPLSTSTDETRVGDLGASPSIEDAPLDHLGFPLVPKKARAAIPEDDGMHELRARIQAINARDIPHSDKARLMHDILLEKYRASQVGFHSKATPERSEPTGQAYEHLASSGPLESLKFWNGQLGDSASRKYFLTEADMAPTYAPIRQPKTPGNETPTTAPSTPPDVRPPLGCQHYERNVKLQCSICSKWYTCRFCHDAHEDHNLIRKDTKNMLCMLCATPQPASDVCVSCGEIAALYYCHICKLWENRPSKPIYHCNDCGICRRGWGLGKDFFHCKTCRACITTSIESSHKCIERSTDCDCPICGEYMFTSPRPVVFMPCGHSIHKKCYEQHMRVSYKCPICNKSLANMETQFRNLDVAIQSQPMPPEFRDTKATVLCNDCSGKCTVPYHWLGLKCSICRSYNTVELQIHGEDSEEFPSASGTSASAAAAAPQLPHDSTRQAMNVADARAVAWVASRRRHSSHGVEFQHHVPDRTARSMSPLTSSMEPYLNSVPADVDSDDDIFGFWRGNVEEEEDDSSDDRESDDESDGLPEIEDDEDDDEDEIVLIGHR